MVWPYSMSSYSAMPMCAVNGVSTKSHLHTHTQLQEVGRALMAKQWKVGRLFQAVLEYCKQGQEDRKKRSLFDTLLAI